MLLLLEGGYVLKAIWHNKHDILIYFYVYLAYPDRKLLECCITHQP